MKLLFVHPGPLLYTSVFLRLEPLGLELVAEAARRRKHAVRLIDLQAESQAAYHRMIAEWLPDFERNQRRDAEINEALKQENARPEAAVKNMYRLRVLRLERDQKA